MTERPRNVLFLCTGNSARSIFAECLLNELGKGKFRGFSAGSDPNGTVHPLALHELERRGLSTEGLRSKDWGEFEQPGAPRMDLVVTVCDKAAAETCPLWPGQPRRAHWGIEDPAAVEGDECERKAAFARAFRQLRNRVGMFVNLPFEDLDELRLQEKLDEIGRVPPECEEPVRGG